MPTKPTTSPTTSYSTDERYFATRYKQGGRTVFSLQLTPNEITSLVKRPDPGAHNPGNRRIRPAHAQAFADYFIEHENWVAPGIILRSPSIFAFDEIEGVEAPTANFGLVSYPRRDQALIQILDGQHRILGFFLAIDKLALRLEKLRDSRAKAKKTEGDRSAAVKQLDREIAALEKVRDRLGTERLTVEIQVTEDVTAYRQMFYDIADNALGITASVKARFDTRKVVNRALPLVMDHKLLEGRVDLEADRVRGANPMLLTAKNVSDVIRVATVGFDGRVGRRMEAELKEGPVAQGAIDILDGLVEAFPQLHSVQDGTLTAPALRSTTMLGGALFLRVLAGVWWELKSKRHGFTSGQVIDFYRKLAKHVTLPIHENSIWKTQLPPEIFTVGQTGPNGQRQSTNALVAAMVDWAIEKPDFLDAEPLPAPVVEADPDEGVDYAPFHDTKKLDVEVRNELEDISTEHKAKTTPRPRARKAPARK